MANTSTHSKQTKNQPKKTRPIDFFVVPTYRLAILSVITLGIYDIYWFYRNWKIIRDTTGEKLSPFWRSVFKIFFTHSLFNKMSSELDARKIPKPVNFVAAATVYVIVQLSAYVLGRKWDTTFTEDITWLVILCLAVVPLVVVQHTINKTINYTTPPRFARGEVILSIFGVIVFPLVLIGIFTPRLPEAPESVKAEMNTLKTRIDKLQGEYTACNTELNARYSSLDNTDQAAVDEYNADVDTCQAKTAEYNTAANKYNQLLSQYQQL